MNKYQNTYVLNNVTNLFKSIAKNIEYGLQTPY